MISNTFRILYLKNLIQFNFRKFLRVFFKKYYTVTWHNLSTRQIFTDVVFSKGSKLNKNIVIIFFNRNSLDGFWKGGHHIEGTPRKHSDIQTHRPELAQWFPDLVVPPSLSRVHSMCKHIWRDLDF